MAVETALEEHSRAVCIWEKIEDTIEGQERLQERATTYLRKPEGMAADTEFLTYAKYAPFYDATSRTVEGLTGMAFAEKPIVTAPTAIADIVADMTLDGVSLEGFAEELFEDVLCKARGCVWVDYPPKDESVRSKRDQELSNRRPSACIIDPKEVFHWTVRKVNGVRQLTQVRFYDYDTTEAEEFNPQTEQRIRVLELVTTGSGKPFYRQRLFGRDEGTKAWGEVDSITPLKDGKPLDRIPFWFVNPVNVSAKMVKPPISGLVDINLAHWNTTAQYENALSFCGAPQPYVTGYIAGEDDGSLTIGSSEAWIFDNPDAKAGYLTLGSEGVDALEKRLDRHEQHMAMLGARMLTPDSKGVEAAETAQIHRQGEVSVVKGICNSVSQSMTEILQFMAYWEGKEDKTISVQLHTDFFDKIMTGGEAGGYMRLFQQGVIAFSDLLLLLKRGKVLANDRTAEEIAAENQTGIITPSSTLLDTPDQV